MTERDLLKKLNNLKNVQPDAAWKKSNREILFSQVSNTSLDSEVSNAGNFWIATKNFFALISQPALTTLGLVIFLMAGLVFSHRILNLKPDSSLYIAKVISEQANLDTIFNKDEKAKMELQFATGHAQDIASTLADPAFNNDQNKEAVAKLYDNFKTEIAKVRALTAAQNSGAAQSGQDGNVYSADSGKDDNGISLSSPNSGNNLPIVTNPSAGEIKTVTGKTATETKASAAAAATSAAACDTSTASSTDAVKQDSAQILNDAEKLFNDKDYSGAADKLNQISQ